MVLFAASISSGTFFLSSSIFTILYGIIVVVYRLLFHPLRHYPGPKLAASTRWYEFYFDLVKSPGGQFAWEIDRMHQCYGPIVRINPDELHVQDPEWVDVLYSRNPTHRDKYPPFAAMTGNPVSSFGTVEHNIHRKRKLATSPFFSKRSVSAAEPLIRAQAEKLCSSLEKSYKNQEIMSLHTRFLAFSTDTVSEFAFAKSAGLQHAIAEEDGLRTEGQMDVEDWAETLKMVGAVFPLLRQFPWMIKVALKIPVVVFRVLVPILSRFLMLHKEMKIRASMFIQYEQLHPTPDLEKRSERPPTVFHAIYLSSLTPEEKTLTRLSQEGLVMLVAGSESTSRGLMLATYYLLTNSEWLEKLRVELDGVMPASKQVPAVKVLEGLPILHAVIKETFRTAAIFTTRFPLTTPETLRYKDWIIPPGTPISMTTRSIMHDPSTFPNPESFNPDRWLKADGTHRKDVDKYYVPFSRGTRMCPGMDLAYAEIYTALAMTVRRFEFELVDTVYDRDIKVVRDCFLGEPSLEGRGVTVKVVGLRQ